MNVSSLAPWLLAFYTVPFFWQFWLLFVFKFVVVLLLVVERGKVYPLTLPSWLEVCYQSSFHIFSKSFNNNNESSDPATYQLPEGYWDENNRR